MPPVKKNTEPAPQRSAGWFFGGSNLPLVVFILAAFIGGATLAWMQMKSRIFSAEDSVVGPGQIELTPPPPWAARSNIVPTVLLSLAAEGRLSIHDENLIMRLKNSFEAHPWIESARVRKMPPAKVKVDAVYRKPVCMIKVPGGRLPVDAHGFLLPSEDFTPIQTVRDYLSCDSVEQMPTTPVGCRWADASVLGAAEIAAAIGDDWKQLEISAIVPQREQTAGRLTEPTFWLATASRGATRIFWGYAPGANVSGDLPAAEKVARLKNYFARGTWDGPENRHQDLDVRSLPPAARQ
jgi:hypothetical protein